MRKIQNVQVLRGLAALGVVGFHAFAGHSFSVVGQAGVDVFFVISGLIISITVQREPTPANFFLHRLVRIAPLYWLATLVMSIHLLPNLPDLVRSILFIPYRNDSGHIWPTLIPGWTLVYEMFFYMLLTGSLFAGRKRALAVTLACLVVLTALHVFAGSNPALEIYTSPLLLEFSAGILLGLAKSRLSALPRLTSYALLVAGGLGFAASRSYINYIGTWRVILWGVPATAVVAAAMALQAEKSPVWLNPLIVLGEASYSLYLVQGLVLRSVERLTSRLPEPLPALSAVATAIAASLIVWWFIERRLNRIGRKLAEHLTMRSAIVPRR